VSERPHFIVHNPDDCVGVVVVEDVKAGQELTGWVMANDATIKLTVQADVPLGHKVAAKPLAKDDTVIEYEHEIGRAIEDIPVGGYVHAHNIKTKRW
jgi:(2R)-sulfolactate sulfo-lyase subunit alpha